MVWFGREDKRILEEQHVCHLVGALMACNAPLVAQYGFPSRLSCALSFDFRSANYLVFRGAHVLRCALIYFVLSNLIHSYLAALQHDTTCQVGNSLFNAGTLSLVKTCWLNHVLRQNSIKTVISLTCAVINSYNRVPQVEKLTCVHLLSSGLILQII